MVNVGRLCEPVSHLSFQNLGKCHAESVQWALTTNVPIKIIEISRRTIDCQMYILRLPTLGRILIFVNFNKFPKHTIYGLYFVDNLFVYCLTFADVWRGYLRYKWFHEWCFEKTCPYYGLHSDQIRWVTITSSSTGKLFLFRLFQVSLTFISCAWSLFLLLIFFFFYRAFLDTVFIE